MRRCTVAGSCHFYPRSPCGERRRGCAFYYPIFAISIHALLAESDAILLLLYFMTSLFLSTLSLRRATRAVRRSTAAPSNFYPRSPCGERQVEAGFRTLSDDISIHALLAESDHPVRIPGVRQTISIHALLAESDPDRRFHHHQPVYFYPRSPCGERLSHGAHIVVDEDFYPRSPCGERRQPMSASADSVAFLSTLSLRRATALSSPMPVFPK